jgi:hypothetical protein
MQILHHIGLRIDDEREREDFLSAGIALPYGTHLPGGGVITSFDITEDDLRWKNIVELLHKRKIVDTVKTIFSDSELNTARYLGMIASSHHGYPQPEQSYLAATYDLKDYCVRCGIGKKQTRPFRLRNTPVLASNSILQLNWIFDEYFVTLDTWEGIFKPLGIANRSAVVNTTDLDVKSLVQLEISAVRDVDLKDIAYEICPVCDRKKYSSSFRGYYPEPDAFDSPMLRSSQWFGAGANGFNIVVISNVLYRKIREAGLEGVEFYPCAESI